MSIADGKARGHRPRLQEILRALFVVSSIGTVIELLLLDHDEDVLQFIPLALIAAALAVVIWQSISQSPASLRVMRWIMIGFILAGPVGIALHYRGSTEFQKEIDPSISGFALFKKAMKAQAPPALAPGLMTQLGVLGLASTYGQNSRSPVQKPGEEPKSNESPKIVDDRRRSARAGGQRRSND